MPWWLALFPVLAGEAYRIQIHPFDFQKDDEPDTYIQGIKQIEVSGGSLFVLELHSPLLLELDLEGRLIRRMGSLGEGPEDWGYYGPLAMSVRDRTVWLVPSHGKSLHYLENGKQLLRFPLKSFLFNRISESTNVFAHNNQFVVVPCHPATRHLAAVHGYDGEIKRYIGDILPIDPALLTKNPALNDTMWVHDGEYWYGLFKFWNRLVIFNEDFEQTADLRLEGEEIDYCEGVFLGDIEPEYDLPPQPFFSDFKIFGDSLYFLCRSILYRVDKRTGKTLARAGFFGKGPEFAQMAPGRLLGLDFFTFLPSGRIVLASPSLPWDHDLWVADLPFLKQR